MVVFCRTNLLGRLTLLVLSVGDVHVALKEMGAKLFVSAVGVPPK